MFAKKKNLKRQDFEFQNGWFEEKTKLPGQLHAQQFQISDCQQCQIYLFDSNAGVFVDDSKYCFIFIGPSQSSIFVRDSHYLNIVCLAKQFRMRDCTNCRVWMWCQSKAVVQSSYDIVFSCFPSEVGYKQLTAQMKQSNLTLWDNNWFDIYDFTPTKFSKTIPNFRLTHTTKQQHSQIIEPLLTKMQKCLSPCRHIIPQIEGIQYCQVNGLKSYSVLVIFPIPVVSVGLPVLQSRVRQIGNQMKEFVSQKYLQSIALFVKVKTADINKWKQLGDQKAKIVGTVADDRGKEALEATVFMPFSDERE